MKKRAWRFLWISLAGILIFYLWAFLKLFRKSFFTSATGTWMGMKNYRDVLGNQAFWMAMKNTCFFLVVSILVLLLLSLFVARILLKNSIVNRIVKKGLLIPFAVPAGAVVFLWNLFFDVHGILNGICSKIGGAPMHWMECKYAMYILVLVYVWKNLGYYVILWTVALNQISESATEAAKVDGAGTVNARKGAADATAEEIAEAQKAYEDAVSEMEVAVSDARSQVESASIRSASSTTAEQLKITRMQTEEKKKSLEGMLGQDGKKCAECSGYIKEVNISVGNDTTGDADVIVTRMDGGMSVEVTISDTEKQYLSAGEQVQVYKEQDAETAGDCEVLSVEKNADTGAWNVLVDVSGLDVKIGDNVGVQILNESEYYPFLIPREALHYKSGGKYFVYIAEETETVMGTETRAAAQEVEVLDMDDVNVAIERISLQTPVIIDSDRQISEDRRVNCEKNET